MAAREAAEVDASPPPLIVPGDRQPANLRDG